MSAQPETQWWTPFPADWWALRRWRQFIAGDPLRGARALAAIRRALPDADLFAQNFVRHPLGVDYATISGRWTMLEVGSMLAELPLLGDYPERLAHRDKYRQTCAELQGGLLFKSMGFDVERDPANARRGRGATVAGPDWAARRGSRRFGVEVKCLQMSDRALGRSTVDALVMFDLMEYGFTNVKLETAASAYAETARTRKVNKPLVHELVLEAAIEAELFGEADTRLGSVRPSDADHLRIDRRGDGIPIRCRLVGPPSVSPDEEYEATRLRTELQAAAHQLEAHRCPGIIVVDCSLDSRLAHRCCAIADSLGEEWASHLAAVFVVMPRSPGFIVKFVAGPQFAEFLEAKPVLSFCANGHAHVSTIGRERDCRGEYMGSACQRALLKSCTEPRWRRPRRGR